jgi:hypothetical protein
VAITSIYDLEQKVKAAKAALAAAKKDKKPKATIDDLTKKFRTAESTLKQVKSALEKTKKN